MRCLERHVTLLCMKRVHFRQELQWIEGEPAFRSSGSLSLAFCETFRPSSQELRAMLQCVAQTLGVSTPQLAAILGASYETVRAWLRGSRSPSGPSSRLIWLLFVQLTAPGEAERVGSWLTWARNPVTTRQET